MRRTATTTALWLTLLLLAVTGSPSRQAVITLRPRAPSAVHAVQAVDVSAPGPGAPTVVRGDLSPNTHAWRDGVGGAPGATGDLPDELLAAYSLAVALAPPGCHLTLPILAAIGQVESGSLAGHALDAGHRVVPEILGPALDGRRFRGVRDTDAGEMDGDRKWDRAMGPMQFLPATWRTVGVDMDGDGERDPQDVYDAAGAAMLYLCAQGRDLADLGDLREALLAYNHSSAYVHEVLAWKTEFDRRSLSDATPSTFFDRWTMSVAESGLRDAVAAAQSRHAAGAALPAPVSARPLPAGGELPSTAPSSPAPGPGSPAQSPSVDPSPDSTPGVPVEPGVQTPPAPPPPPGPDGPGGTPPQEPPPVPDPLPTCPVPGVVTPPVDTPAPEAPPAETVPPPDLCLPPPPAALDPAAADPVPADPNSIG